MHRGHVFFALSLSLFRSIFPPLTVSLFGKRIDDEKKIVSLVYQYTFCILTGSFLFVMHDLHSIYVLIVSINFLSIRRFGIWEKMIFSITFATLKYHTNRTEKKQLYKSSRISRFKWSKSFNPSFVRKIICANGCTLIDWHFAYFFLVSKDTIYLNWTNFSRGRSFAAWNIAEKSNFDYYYLSELKSISRYPFLSNIRYDMPTYCTCIRSLQHFFVFIFYVKNTLHYAFVAPTQAFIWFLLTSMQSQNNAIQSGNPYIKKNPTRIKSHNSLKKSA